MIAVSIFAVISTIVAGLYIQSFRESASSDNQNQIYEDARFIVQQIGNEIRNGAIDYDEYYNQNIVNESVAPAKSAPFGTRNYGQNFGRYYSSFFNPGEDSALGFDCNNNIDRNKSDCTPLRRTIDRNTGQNPFSGKYLDDTVIEDAFCGYVSYKTDIDPVPPMVGDCPAGQIHAQPELYLISADSFEKTILARELTSDPSATEKTYALSILRLKGTDTDGDEIPDAFACADEFICDGGLPRLDTKVDDNDVFGDLNEGAVSADPKDKGFSNNFVPISPLSVNISDLKFYISPSDDSAYAFAEKASVNQPNVTIVLTVSPIGDNKSSISPVTLVETVPTQMLTPILAPIKMYSPNP